MKILITAGSTSTMIDKVRVITNVFKGKTGFAIAEDFTKAGHEVHFMTSNVSHTPKGAKGIIHYKTFDDLYGGMKEMVMHGNFDAIIHSAAVSDYKTDGVFIEDENKLVAIDSSTKISSQHNEMFLKLVQTEKIIDKISEWGFTGTLIKFKLQVDMSDAELVSVATKSMHSSNADFIVANCLEHAKAYAIIISANDHQTTDYQYVSRDRIGSTLVNLITGE